MSEAVQNTDRELYREDTNDPAGSYYENSVHVTQDGLIGMNVGGLTLVDSIDSWHQMRLDVDAYWHHLWALYYTLKHSEKRLDLPQPVREVMTRIGQLEGDRGSG